MKIAKKSSKPTLKIMIADLAIDGFVCEKLAENIYCVSVQGPTLLSGSSCEAKTLLGAIRKAWRSIKRDVRKDHERTP